MVIRATTHCATYYERGGDELILNNAIRLQARILAPLTSLTSSQQVALSDTMDEWIAKQHILITVARETQLTSDAHPLVEYDPRITDTPTCTLHSSRSFQQTPSQTSRFGETCESLMHVGKLHDYLRTNTMKMLIPKEHK